MNDPNYDSSSIPVATVVEPEKKMSAGCIVSIIVAVFVGLVSIFVAFIGYFVWSDFSESTAENRPKILTESALRDEAITEIDRAKTAYQTPAKPEDHPQYDRLMKFVETVQPALDETSNPRLQRLVDYEEYLSELARRSEFITDSKFSRRLYLASLKENIIGPTPFTSFEILRIETEAENRYRVYLSCYSTYQTSEPRVWWVSDKGTRLKIYDWEQLELGLRSSAESAIVAGASSQEERYYDQYVNRCIAYLAIDYSDHTYEERKKLVRKALTACEDFRGPKLLRPGVHLVNAQRWYAEGENDRALALLRKIEDVQIVPGVHRLRGDIEFEQGNYDAATESYRKFTEQLGAMPHVQNQLAMCYRELGDTEAERKMLLESTESINENNYRSLASLIELNNAAQNLELFTRIDSLENRDAAYMYLISSFSNSDYFSDKLKQLVEHIDKINPDSRPAIFGKIAMNSDLESLMAGLKWVDQLPDPDPEDNRSSFWYDVDEDHIIELFESSQEKLVNFETIFQLNEYEGIISDEVMMPICESVLKIDPDNYQVLYQMGSIANLKRDFKSAAEYLTKAMKLVPEGNELESTIQHELLSTYYKNGENEKAVQFAIDTKTIEELFRMKNAKDDFSGFDKMLIWLKSDTDESRFQNALLNQHNGKSDSALKALANLISKADDDDGYNYQINQYREKLLQICIEQKDPTQAVALVPTETMFSFVSERLIRDFDWSNCQKLLSFKQAELQPAIFKLQQRIHWEQGDYEKVLNNSTHVIELARNDTLYQEFDQLVRSAIRLGKLNLARKFADRAVDYADRQDLLTIVAILQKQTELVTSQISRLSESQILDIFDDPDLNDAIIREVFRNVQRPPRELSYYSPKNQLAALELMFKQRVEFDRDQLLKKFERFGPDVTVEHVTTARNSNESWSILTPTHRIFVSQDPIGDLDFADPFENDELQNAIEASKYRVNIDAFGLTPTTSQADNELLLNSIQCLINPDLSAVGQSYQWLSAKDVNRFFDEKKEDRSSRLFGLGETYQGEFHYFDDDADDEMRASRLDSFIEEFSSALRKFRDSDDSDKSMVVQIILHGCADERVSAKVNNIRRTGYRSVILDVTIENDARFETSIRKGDRGVVSIYNVVEFDFKADGAVIQRELDSD